MGKRKRIAVHEDQDSLLLPGEAEKFKVVHRRATPVTIQIIIGTYEKVLHGITASITSLPTARRGQDCIDFADTFLLNAHTSAIRCLAVRMPLPNLFLLIPTTGPQDLFWSQKN